MDSQVIVVGAGPVGLLLAGELRLGGAEVLVLERLSGPSTESRASTLHARTVELFAQRGLVGALGDPPSTTAGHFGGLPLDFGDLPSDYPGQWKVPQTRTTEVLHDWATALGAEVRRGHEVRELIVHPDHVEIGAAGPAGRVRLRASYVVGCDGENSAVRRLAGFGFPGTSRRNVLLRADVAGIRIPARRFERTPAGLAISARNEQGITRVMVCEPGRSPAESARQPAFADVAAAWSRVTGEDISGGEPLWVNAFDDTNRQASRYRRGRVLLAGDAAHVQMPSGGQALNLGLQDAANLGWKLAAQVRGQAPDGLLDTYHDERWQTGKKTLDNIAAQASLLLGGGEVDGVREVIGELLGHREVREFLTGRISGLDIRYEPGAHRLHGRRMPHCRVRTPDGVTSTAELLAEHRGVLLVLPGEHSERLVAVAAPWASRLGIVRGEVAEDHELSGVAAVLVRPDGYVAWIGDDVRGVEAALGRWFGARATPQCSVSAVSERDQGGQA
ncbi:FAD-dependent monooxygenase [Saccharopolyspora indica]|uniref:FAD-dependent monooxygenase n=1 Tax=Saccharopolyspora indica TaxID=1229659 RepID=UPI0022EA60CB|nr:FAD-dependent monooxygenase [Saccharopolyspora indica]MDA3645735.1 FAD-dependent monooxygenase [Saccharopolyspora indica]